ncbi:hypothetical protein LCGC14_0849520 [marine sediment metagenome]|uniref:Uncharacterized protein n=1 Tax=marine sediment metagenome TaxID=412755 RepID=A0A0F9PFI4_9ZZZZ
MITLILVYIIGISGMWPRWIAGDAECRILLPLWWYVILCIFWPLSIWFWMYTYYNYKKHQTM